MSTVRLRLATPDDAAAVQRIYAPYVEETAVSFEDDPPTVAEMRDRIASKPPSHPWLVAVADDVGVVGYAYGSTFRSRRAYRWAVESSVYVASDAQRGGVARSLYTALFDLLDRQGYRTVYAGMTTPNAASAGLHESMGFTSVGTFENAGYKNGSWHDVQWWQRSLGDAVDDERNGDEGRNGPPAAPRPLTDLPDEAVAAVLGGVES